MKNPQHAKLTEAIVKELADETDEHLALRRALLHCVVLLEQSKDPAARNFVDYLLVEFAPLAAGFADERHPYLQPFDLTRARLPNKHFTAFPPFERLTAWLRAG